VGTALLWFVVTSPGGRRPEATDASTGTPLHKDQHKKPVSQHLQPRQKHSVQQHEHGSTSRKI